MIANKTPALKNCCPVYLRGFFTVPFNFAQASIDPVNVIAPMTIEKITTIEKNNEGEEVF